MTKHSTRLFAILAREAPRAIIFRRGPSKHVLLIAWNLQNDTFEAGQWFKGRIYEDKCDLSPNGEKLVYLAAKGGDPLGSWTAISKPPYLTALCMYPLGHTWGGGGCFTDDSHVVVDHPVSSRDPVKLTPSPGEPCVQFPIDSLPVWRDKGWRNIKSPYKTVRMPPGSKLPLIHVDDLPGIDVKACPRNSTPPLELRRSIIAMHEANGPWHTIDHEVLATFPTGEVCRLCFERTDWADWDRNGDLLYSRGGKLFRLSHNDVANGVIATARELADFSDLTFTEVKAPDHALHW